MTKEMVMPRRRQRKTGWQPQDQRRLRIRGIRLDTPDVRKLSRAFIGLALARAEAETQARAEAEARSSRSVVAPDDPKPAPDDPALREDPDASR
jgi:hypothetical protein